MTQETKPASTKEIFLRTVAVLGLVAVLLLGAWGIIQLAVNLPGFFSNIGDGFSSLFSKSQNETLVVSAPASVGSGQALDLSWVHTGGSGNYSYAVSYACQSGLSMKAPLPNGNYQDVPCNAPFNYVQASEHMRLIPASSGSTPTAAVLTVSAVKLDTGAIATSSSAVTAVVPVAQASAPAKPATTTTTIKKKTATGGTYTNAPRVQLYGLPDLAVRILSVTPRQGGLVAAQFSIENDGTNATPWGWSFIANLPSGGGYSYSAQPQQVLYPGDRIIYTLTFAMDTYQTAYPQTYQCSGCIISSGTTGGYNNTGTVSITADPYNQVYELNEGNNTASAPVTNTYGSGYSNYNYGGYNQGGYLYQGPVTGGTGY